MSSSDATPAPSSTSSPATDQDAAQAPQAFSASPQDGMLPPGSAASATPSSRAPLPSDDATSARAATTGTSQDQASARERAGQVSAAQAILALIAPPPQPEGSSDGEAKVHTVADLIARSREGFAALLRASAGGDATGGSASRATRSAEPGAARGNAANGPKRDASPATPARKAA